MPVLEELRKMPDVDLEALRRLRPVMGAEWASAAKIARTEPSVAILCADFDQAVRASAAAIRVARARSSGRRRANAFSRAAESLLDVALMASGSLSGAVDMTASSLALYGAWSLPANRGRASLYRAGHHLLDGIQRRSLSALSAAVQHAATLAPSDVAAAVARELE